MTAMDVYHRGDQKVAECGSIDLEQHISRLIDKVYDTGKISIVGHQPHAPMNHISPNQGRLLRDLVVQSKARRTLEIGMGTGLSGLHICWGLIRNGGGRHLAIDPFQKSEYWQGMGLGLRDQAGCTNMFDWTDERDDQALPRLLLERQSFELALIDGDHRFESAFLNFYYIDRMLSIDGVCVFDDTDWPSVWRIVCFARKYHDYEWLDALPIHLGPWYKPWGWRLRAKRLRTFKSNRWPLREALLRRPYSMIALRKKSNNIKPEAFWIGV